MAKQFIKDVEIQSKRFPQKTRGNDNVKDLLNEILTPDQRKVMYRGRYTVKQAALFFGKGEDYVWELIEKGLLGHYYEEEQLWIPRAECERLENSRVKYKNGKKVA